ncbi:PAS domain-containing sensor histidine kinase [Dyadobacter frigoris]|uniref:histidine kinase n=2 Tax=Dyadobacter frigoris TaxID=2576211 RepID=A0A4U6D2U6_9BACT|nr:PAS domain-containing sensor histidine kinase [Dyadobacter frigoris]
MGELTQNFDWETSPVGKPSTWPQSLRTIVSMILLSKFPMFLWWGQELVQFYNDAYRPSLGNDGKHPRALGQRGEECWPEIWPTIKPLIDQVMTTGVATWNENQLIPIFLNGRIEDVYWTFGYSAVLDDAGQIGGVLVVCQEITQMVIAKKALEQSENRFRSIIEQAPLAVCLLNGPELEIGVGNDSIFKVWGKDKSIVGKRLIEALPELKDQSFIPLLENVYSTGKPHIGQSMLAKLFRNETLEDVYFDFVYTPVRDNYNQVNGVLVLAIEVTQQALAKQIIENSEAKYRTLCVELEQQVQNRTAELLATVQDLKHSNENLHQFTYVASHDLQEPLRKIMTFGDLLKKSFPEQLATGIDYIARMQSAASRMSTLIVDLLTYSHIPVLQTSANPVSTTEIIRLVLSDLELTIEQTKASIIIGQIPQITGDATQLGQLFQNLLSNALKFQKAGVAPLIKMDSQIVLASDLKYNVKPARQALQYHRIDITDNGTGFDSQYNDRIFQVFQRLHGKNEFAGSGIGLSICAKIATNHGGTIIADSVPGEGTTFSLYLPADEHD